MKPVVAGVEVLVEDNAEHNFENVVEVETQAVAKAGAVVLVQAQVQAQDQAQVQAQVQVQAQDQVQVQAQVQVQVDLPAGFLFPLQSHHSISLLSVAESTCFYCNILPKSKRMKDTNLVIPKSWNFRLLG